MGKVEQRRKRSKALANQRKKRKVCVRCEGKLNHLKAHCDFCYLRRKIKELDNTQKRIISIL